MNYKQLIHQVSFACFAVLFIEGFQPQKAVSEWFRPLYAGQSDWIKWSLNPGEYILDASTLLNVGDVDIEVYDYTSKNLLFRGNQLGGENIPFTVNQGGDFYIKYSMTLCVNPFGACAVEININKVQ